MKASIHGSLFIQIPQRPSTLGRRMAGQGTETAFRQMMCDELDIAFDKTDLIMGRTDITVDQGGSGGSTSIERDSKPMRLVAAELQKQSSLEVASARFGVPVDLLAVRDGADDQGSNRISCPGASRTVN